MQTFCISIPTLCVKIARKASKNYAGIILEMKSTNSLYSMKNKSQYDPHRTYGLYDMSNTIAFLNPVVYDL